MNVVICSSFFDVLIWKANKGKCNKKAAKDFLQRLYDTSLIEFLRVINSPAKLAWNGRQ